ncbi:MAG: ParB/RepB/Spo0J family partition protein [Terriglobales bacterium]
MNSPNPARKALGRGLDALLSPVAATPDQLAGVPPPGPAPETVRQLPLSVIEPNPFQPRQQFRPEALAELAASIRAQGVMQPVLVRPQGQRFQLLAGERRFRAAQLAGLTAIPALIRALGDDHALEYALIENLQREDLNPLEQARAFQQLATRFAMTQEHIAQRTGKDRASIANYLRLLKLAPAVQSLVEAGRLSMGHARALLALPAEAQPATAARALAGEWSVRRLESHVRGRTEPAGSQARRPAQDANVRHAADELARALGAKVAVRDKSGRGIIEIHYHGVNDFQRLFERLVGPSREP